jgi:hypothetical protein
VRPWDKERAVTTLILDEEQAKLIRSSKSGETRDRSGNLPRRFLVDDLDEDIRSAQERLAPPGKTLSTAEVLGHLRSLAPE